MTWTTQGSAATWPAYAPKLDSPFSGTLTLRVNTDAGLAFLIGTYTAPGNEYQVGLNTADPLPAVFRPLANVTLVSTANSVNTLIVQPNGLLVQTSNSSPGNNSYRGFYFTTVNPG